MIITLTRADFSSCKIGTLTTFNVRKSTVIGASVNIIKTSVERAGYSSATTIATIVLDEANYEGHAIKVMMGSTDVSSWYSLGNVIVPANTPITSNITITVSATAVAPDVPVTPSMYTFTINPTPSTATVTLIASGYTQSGNSISVASGTTVSWTVSADGYYDKNGSETITIDKTLNVSLSEVVNSGEPTTGTLFDFDFVNNTIDKYVSDGIITIPNTSKTDSLTYSSKGMTTTSTALPAALNNGVKLANPFDLASQSWVFEITMTMDSYDSESMGTSVTETLYPNMAFFSATEHDTLPDGKAHGSNCLAPAIYINGGKFSGRFPQNGNVTIGSSAAIFDDDGLEHTYTWQYNKDTNTNTLYKDGAQVYNSKWTNTTADFGGSIQYLLGVHYGYSSAKNFCIKKGMHIKSMKMYTN